MSKLLIANWKMNPQTEAEAVRLARAEDAPNVVVAPPFPFLRAVGGVLRKAALGAQDVFWEPRGAFTGEVSPTMLKRLGVRYVIVGHSEQRQLGETDAMVNRKVLSSLEAGLGVILCVGEGSGARAHGFGAAQRFVAAQLRADLRGVKVARGSLSIAYEPLWAISTARSANYKDNADTPEDAAAMIDHIRTFVRARLGVRPLVFYGGSVNGGNAARFLGNRGIDGALVGGASLNSKEFIYIVKMASSAGER